MAGWDGDDLAGSMEDTAERQQEAADMRARKGRGTPAERKRDAHLESQRLSRSRLEEQLGRATSPAHKAMLERALKAFGADTSGDAPEKPGHD